MKEDMMSEEEQDPSFWFDPVVMMSEWYVKDMPPESEVRWAANWWPVLIDGAREGILDLELFDDMASFAFDDFVKEALEDCVSRVNAYQAFAIKEFADVKVEGDELLIAARLVAEALSTQACAGWQLIDGKVSSDKLVVYTPSGERVIISMHPIDFTPLLEAIAGLGAPSKFQ